MSSLTFTIEAVIDKKLPQNVYHDKHGKTNIEITKSSYKIFKKMVKIHNKNSEIKIEAKHHVYKTQNGKFFFSTSRGTISQGVTGFDREIIAGLWR